MKRLIIDGENLLYRSYWTAAPKHNGENTPMYVHVFLNILKSYVNIFNPNEIIVTWDYREEGYTNERKEMNGDYKSNRVYMPEIHEYVPHLKDILSSLGIKQIHPRYREADDILYWLCAYKYPGECVMVSTDTDMYQLVLPHLKGNVIWNPTKKEVVDETYLLMYYDVNDGNEFIIKKSIRGDKADCIEGIKGMRSTKIKKIIEVLGSDFNTLALKESKLLTEEQYDKFIHNSKLMRLETIKERQDEISFYEELLNIEPKMDKELFRTLVTELGLDVISLRLDRWFSSFRLKNEEEDYSQYVFDFSSML